MSITSGRPRLQAADHPPADSFYVWGPTPPEDFAFNHELAA